MNADMDLLQDFTTDSRDHLASIEDDFLALNAQKDNPNSELLNKVFRAVHSIKGSAGFFGLTNINRLTHVMESLLVLVKQGDMKMEQPVVESLLAGVDRLNVMLNDVEHSNELNIDAEETRIVAILNGGGAPTANAVASDRAVVIDLQGKPVGMEIDALALKEIPRFHNWLYVLRFDLNAFNAKTGKTPTALVRDLLQTGLILECHLHEPNIDLRAGLPEGPLNVDMLYSTVLEPDLIRMASNLSDDRIIQVKWVQPGEPAPTAASAPTLTRPLAPPHPVTPAPVSEPLAPHPDPVAVEVPASAESFEFIITPEMCKRFCQESIEILDAAEQTLLRIEKEGDPSTELTKDAFRGIHSFKGNCGFMGLADMERVAHAMENVLGAFKEQTAKPDSALINVLLGVVDTLRNSVNELASGGKGGVTDAAGLCAILTELVSGTHAGAPVVPSAPPAASARPISAAGATEYKRDSLPAAGNSALLSTSPAVRPALSAEARAKEPPALSIQPAGPDAKPGAAPTSSSAPNRQDIRVDLTKLDTLINLVGELVIAEAMVVRHPVVRDAQDESLERAIHHLRRISSDLQDIAMTVRMIPLSATFRKMTRLIHDLSIKSGKPAALQLVGEETEVDKTVIEMIGDPLVHIVRNAMDHGLEQPAQRRTAGKPESGTITIEARHEGGEVWIIIKDDGRGLDRDKILKKAIEKGLVKTDGVTLSDEEVFRFIFEPGFSTADKVTDISGRGVGMDVVKRNIEKLKGRVDVRSTLGQGATVILHIPLTLAIVDGMLVRVGKSHYTIPLLSIRESIRVDLKDVTILPDGQEIVRLREQMIPVLRLYQFFGQSAEIKELEKGILVVAESEGQAAGFLVDEIVGQNQTVIKGLSDYLGRAHGVSGCTILGDGEVSLILDVGGLIRKALGGGKGVSSDEINEG